jgi:aminopeptidase N
MHFVCSTPTNKVVFHSLDLKIDAPKLAISSLTDLTIRLLKNVEFDEKRDFVVVYLTDDCKQGQKYVLTIEYTGLISSNLYGFYRSSYVDNQNKTF